MESRDGNHPMTEDQVQVDPTADWKLEKEIEGMGREMKHAELGRS